MYLKSIDMYGFKSFAHKIVFKFDEGITGIVGPNGSGKSNIADAVRWVLGEQSAKILRGANMQDVIFAGTENRRPLGYCQVDLTIDNHDMKMPISYSEVTVSRRVYRSGESEYYINGTACRLKDIHELFMDTGVGKEGYSIIGQGQIDKILSAKPDDRRALFDEAAGIVKFKKRKISAEKKLLDEKQNLFRINDIIRELEGQQETLNGQAEIAKKYLAYKEELKKYEINIFIHESDKMNNNIEQILEKERIVNEQIIEVKKENDQIKEKHTELIKTIDSLEKEIDAKKEKETRLKIEKEKNESAIELSKEQINNISVNLQRMELQNKELIGKQDRNSSERDSYKKKLEELINIYDEKNLILSEMENSLQEYSSLISDDEQRIEETQTNIIEKLNEISNTKSKILRFSTMLENIDSRKEVITARRLNIETNIESMKNDAEINRATMEELYSEQKELTSKKDSFNSIIRTKEDERKQLDQRINQKTQQLHTAKSKYKALNDLTEHYEGYNYSIKKIMEVKHSNHPSAKGIIGVVADIINVKKEYETAIEIALGGSVQNILTNNEATAKQMIQYLKSNRFGRATFLPVTSIKNRGKYNKLSAKDIGFLGYANELVHVDDSYSHVVAYLLGHVVVVDTLDHGVQLAKKYNYSLKIVTLAGELINPGGSLTGGAYKNNGNQFLSRKRETSQYQKAIKTFSDELLELEEQLEQVINTFNHSKKNIEDITRQEHELSLSMNSLALTLKQLENEVNKHVEELNDINLELSQLMKQKSEMLDTKGNLENSLEDIQIENRQSEELVKQLNDKIQDKRNEKENISDLLTTIKVEVSTVKQQLENAKENTFRVDREIQEIQSQIQKNNEEIEQNKKDSVTKQEGINDIILLIGNLDASITSINEEIGLLHNNKHNISEKQENLYKLRDEHNESINVLEKNLLRLQNSKEKYEIQKENQIDYMWNEYELTFNKALSYRDESLGSVTNMKKMISSLKGDIKLLGDVNVNAIEEFKTVQERYQFLTTQRDDLVEAEEKLVKVIDDLQSQMKRQFREKFKEISIKFSEVFKELFGGGKAFLQLTEDEDILEAGIDIIAQPPGKKLQSMRLLSGGEKAFIAIALLFAIQSLKPSPFCVLDEIEAALDDSNVVRFANYLKKLTKNTQFIIITHRRGTMEVADALYGITMQEKGLSTQVSVKLLEDVLDD